MQAITADTVIAYITHDDRRQAGTERGGLYCVEIIALQG